MNPGHHGIDDPWALQVARLVDGTRVLGPGLRAVVVVQGCMLRCTGCIAAATHPLDGGASMPVEELARHLEGLPDIKGVTYSGGEPFLQASALVALTDRLQELRPELSFMSYSGYRLEWLRRRGSHSQRALLDRLDLLVDGPYVERRHRPLRWRGSANQRLLALTDRHAADVTPDESAGLELELDDRLGLSWVGVPPRPGFEATIDAAAGRVAGAWR